MAIKPEAILKEEIHHTKKYWFFISYFADGEECFPMEIRPQIDITSYDINYNKQKGGIMAISNRSLQTEIKWHDMSLQDKEGYVQDTEMRIWTQKVDGETLNIVHIHVNDTSDEVTLDVAYMHEGESLESF